jgi:hypothetical protein
VLPRGFKAEAERQSVTLRAELGLAPTDPLSPAALAAHLGVGYRSAAELVPIEALRSLDALQPGCFSACTLQGPDGPVVVFNPINTVGRRQSDSMHELSHVLLRHETRRLERIGGLVFLTCDPDQEEQADNLGATLLLPRPLLIAAHERGMTAAAIAVEVGVSEQLARWRLNSSGVALQVRRRAGAR